MKKDKRKKRSNTMSVHRLGDRKHTQVKSSSKRSLAQSSRSHLVGFSHEYFTKNRRKSKVTPTEDHQDPFASSVPLRYHFPPTRIFFPRSLGTDTHAIFSKKRKSTTVQTRSSHEFLAVLSPSPS